MGNISDFFTLGRVSPFRNPSVLLQNSSRSSESLSHQSIYPSLNRDFIRYPPQKPPINESLGRKIIYRSWHFPWVFPMATKTWSPATALAAPKPCTAALSAAAQRLVEEMEPQHLANRWGSSPRFFWPLDFFEIF